MKIEKNVIGFVQITMNHWYLGTHYEEFTLIADNNDELYDLFEINTKEERLSEIAYSAIKYTDKYLNFDEYHINFGILIDKEVYWTQIDDTIINDALIKCRQYK